MPEFFLPWGFDFRSVRDICLLPAHILELLPSLSSLFSSFQGDTLGRGPGRGGRNRPRSGNVWAEFIRNCFSSYRSSSSWWSPSMYDRWREAASRIFLSAIVHGDDVHLYCRLPPPPPPLPLPLALFSPAEGVLAWTHCRSADRVLFFFPFSSLFVVALAQPRLLPVLAHVSPSSPSSIPPVTIPCWASRPFLLSPH